MTFGTYLRTGAVSLALLMLVFPGSRVSAAPPYEGYTFCASGATGFLLDMDGTVLHTWQASGAAQTCAYLLEDGSALFPIQNSLCTSPHHDGAFPHGRFQKIGWDGDILWDYRFCDATARAGYDVHPMPNGNILIPTDAAGVAKIFEVQPTGSTTGIIVWQCALPDSLTSGNTYMNSVAYNPELDLIVLDMQEPIRKCVVIDHSVPGGSVLHTYRVPGTGRVHAATWVHRYHLGTDTEMPDIDPAAMRLNNLLVVHNGGDRVAEFNWVTGAMTTIPFSFQDHEGSVQRLPNGNTLVTRGGGTSITELNDAGTAVSTVTAPGNIQRAYRYGPTYGGVQQLWPEGVVAPPPAASSVRIVLDRSAETGRVFLADPKGPSMFVQVVSVGGGVVRSTSSPGTVTSFSTEGLPAGVYFVQVRHGGAVDNTRFVIVR